MAFTIARPSIFMVGPEEPSFRPAGSREVLQTAPTILDGKGVEPTEEKGCLSYQNVSFALPRRFLERHQ